MAFLIQEVRMGTQIAVVVGYLVVLLGIGWAARSRARRGLEDYFVASRTTPPLILFLTMAATNFSAFTVFGFAGAGWEAGYAYYPIMAFGTGFMALTFLLIGLPAWKLGKEHGLITPPELVRHLTGSSGLRLLFFVVMTVFTIPYLAMQPMAAGYALHTLLGIPYFAGAALITAVMLLYTFLGGFRGVSWTDALQGGMMIGLLVVAVAFIAEPLGGLTAANQAVASSVPELFSRPGLGGLYTPGIWLGYMLLWFLADPMFPQLFQRFYAGRGPRALSTTVALYPLLTGFLFLLPVTIGVLGRLSFPVLPAGMGADQILPLMLHEHAPAIVEALVLTAALAALMSTLDSQLLTLSSMFTHDVVAPIWKRRAKRAAARSSSDANAVRPLSPWVGKAFVVGLALIGLAIAYRPPASFRVIATQTFTGLAVLFPVVIGALYWKRMTSVGGVASILVGEGLVVAYYFKLLPTFGTLPVIPILIGSTAALIVVSLLTHSVSWRRPRRQHISMSNRAKVGWALAFCALFFLGNDVWNWGSDRLWLLGFPWWVWMFAGLCALTAATFWLFARAATRCETDTKAVE
jgi:SSS family solute:Na+ symporter